MNATEHTKTLRRVAMFSWTGTLITLLGLAWAQIIPFNEHLPFVALMIGTIPVLLAAWKWKATCGSCGGRMKISSGFPRIVYRCRGCGAENDTGILSD